MYAKISIRLITTNKILLNVVFKRHLLYFNRKYFYSSINSICSWINSTYILHAKWDQKPSKAGKSNPEYSSNPDHYLVNTGSESIWYNTELWHTIHDSILDRLSKESKCHHVMNSSDSKHYFWRILLQQSLHS